jgi:hypothetical protein
LWLILLPELGRFAPCDQQQALHEARQTEFDVLELLGIAFGLILVTAGTRYVLPDAAFTTRAISGFLNLLVAFPLLCLAAGPFYLRRLRRGLRRQLDRRGPAT